MFRTITRALGRTTTGAARNILKTPTRKADSESLQVKLARQLLYRYSYYSSFSCCFYTVRLCKRVRAYRVITFSPPQNIFNTIARFLLELIFSMMLRNDYLCYYCQNFIKSLPESHAVDQPNIQSLSNQREMAVPCVPSFGTIIPTRKNIRESQIPSIVFLPTLSSHISGNLSC